MKGHGPQAGTRARYPIHRTPDWEIIGSLATDTRERPENHGLSYLEDERVTGSSAPRLDPRAVGWLSAIVAAAWGSIAAWHYHQLGLTLTHYDARGHLIVARRIIDSITPGWQQIGAVWLPLPHLLNMLPVQIDAAYRTGVSGVIISMAAFAVASGSIAWIVTMLTGCSSAAFAAAAVFVLNPNILYLQSTPMTEPLLLALTTLSVALLIAYLLAVGAEGEADIRAGRARVGWVFALSCLTRYEAWPVTFGALALAVLALWRGGTRPADAVRRIAPIAAYPVVAILAFLVFSRVVIGEWFVASGFFVPENKALGLPVLATAEVWWGTHELSGSFVIAVAGAGLALVAVRGLFVRVRAYELVTLALLGTAALPWAAFVKGHPFRIRYMVPLVAIEAIGVGSAARFAGRYRPFAAAALLALAFYELHPLDARAPMVVEAQWDRPNMAARNHVTDCLRASWDGEKIMASMGSLGHYMQEASAEGFDIRDFLHEGNGDIWIAAYQRPHPFAGWLLIEEKAEGGDMLAKRAREEPRFLAGYARVCDGAGMALYRRTPETADR